MGNCCSTSPAPQELESSDNFFHCLRALSAHWVVSFWELLQQDIMIAGSIKRCGEKIISQQTYKWILKGLGKDIPSNDCNATSEREGMRSAVQSGRACLFLNGISFATFLSETKYGAGFDLTN